MGLTNDERLKSIDEKLQQLKNQKQAILNSQRKKEHKERTRRLIQKGALAEKFFNCDVMSPEDFEKLLVKIVSLDAVKNIILKQAPSQEIPVKEPDEKPAEKNKLVKGNPAKKTVKKESDIKEKGDKISAD